jgi:hypothetical protein
MTTKRLFGMVMVSSESEIKTLILLNHTPCSAKANVRSEQRMGAVSFLQQWMHFTERQKIVQKSSQMHFHAR